MLRKISLAMFLGAVVLFGCDEPAEACNDYGLGGGVVDGGAFSFTQQFAQPVYAQQFAQQQFVQYQQPFVQQQFVQPVYAQPFVQQQFVQRFAQPVYAQPFIRRPIVVQPFRRPVVVGGRGNVIVGGRGNVYGFGVRPGIRIGGLGIGFGF